MITKSNLEEALKILGYIKSQKVYSKHFVESDCLIHVDFDNQKISYPEDKGFKVNDTTTCNFEHPENFVVLECVTRLLDKGYRPEHLELEKRWTLGHEQKSGKADICVHDVNGTDMLCIIECKTDGPEYSKELGNMNSDGGQLFSYWQQERSAKWLILYASTISAGKIEYTTESVDCSDDANILELAKKDESIRVYEDAHTVNELFDVWSETYEKRVCGDVVFRDDTVSYSIGVKPLRKKDLIDFSEDDKIVNNFEEILRHNNVSDKENAFNRLIALFICKLVDEIQKDESEIVEFQYKVGTDTYESLQDRLQKLHKEGMEKFMREKIFYIADDYAEKLVQQYTGQKRAKMIAELKNTLRILKFYTNNDFAFKDVHNEELFYQNGKILVEMVQLFEKYRIIGSQNLQLLGDLFEQLLNKGFKQNEGQFFTPLPITRFIWNSLPIERIVRKENKVYTPRIIDYACGAGHFLTEGFETINDYLAKCFPDMKIDYSWVEENLYGIEKDYRLARVSKISLFMHGAGDGNIIFGDGLENYEEKGVVAHDFDILVANPPYSVAAFKPHLKLKENELSLLDAISNNGSEIETLFVERVAQLLKPNGIAAIILPSSILSKDGDSFSGARSILLENFKIRAVVSMGGKTFGATGTNTSILFLEKFDEPPKRSDLVTDSVNAIFNGEEISDWEDNEILYEYLGKIGVSFDDYRMVVERSADYTVWEQHPYFHTHFEAFETSSTVTQKRKQKSFTKLDEDQQLKWLNSAFYDFITEIESEKIRFYSYIYQQTTLIIQAPDDNKEQEKFLGYKWSNRKGSEGIQIISPGGEMYDDSNRFSDEVLAALIRESFNDQQNELEDLSEYYYYLRLQDMIDFSGINFNKAIKTTKYREKKPREGFELHSLGNKKMFTAALGDRVVADEQLVDGGQIPVISANVNEVFGYIDKENMPDYNVDSIVWGIDGDWMVNVIPAGKPFYPTDHCGVLRTTNPDIVPKYLALALEVEGKYERFSRYNRASTQRVKALSLYFPDKKKQEAIVAEIGKIDDRIQKNESAFSDYDKQIMDKYEEMFGRVKKKKPIGEVCSIKGRIGWQGLTTKEYKTKGDYHLVTGVDFKNHRIDFDHCYYVEQERFDQDPNIQLIEGDVLVTKDGTIGKVAIVEKLTIPATLNSGVFVVRDKSGELNNIYLAYSLLSYDFERFIEEIKRNWSNISHLTQGVFEKYEIPIADKPEQDKYAEFVKGINKKQRKIQDELSELSSQRQALMDKYFS